MPQFTVQDPDTGRTVTLEGDSAPSERELAKIFNQLKTPAEKATDVAGDLATEYGAAMAGQIAGAETGPGFFVIAPAAAAYGTYARQKRQIERGERDGHDYFEMFTSGLVNAVPFSAFAKGGASTAKYLGRLAKIGAVTHGGAEAADVARRSIEENRIPSYDEYLSVAKESTKGAIVGAGTGLVLDRVQQLSGPAIKFWGRLTGKTKAEANQLLREVADSGTKAEQQAAAEVVDAVGQDMGFVRPSAKSAQESAGAMLDLGAIRPNVSKSATESTAAMLGEEAVGGEYARRVSDQLAKAERERIVKETALAAERAVAGQRAAPARVMSPAEESAQVLQSVGTAQESARAMLPKIAQALEGQPGTGAVGAAIRARSEQEAKFLQQKAEELQQALRGGQAAGPETVKLTPPTAAERYAAGEAPEALASKYERPLTPQEQLNRLSGRPGMAAQERERILAREGLPTTEDVINEFSGLRGIQSKQKARQFMEGGSANAGVMAGVGALGAAGLIAASEAQAKPDTIIVRTPAGDLKYDPNVMSLDEIQQDAARRVKEFRKMEAAAPHIQNRADYQNAPDDQTRQQVLLNWSTGKDILGDVAKTTMQAAGSRLPMPLRPVVGAGAEWVKGQITGEPTTAGQLVSSGVSMIPRGGTSFGPNFARFAGANVSGEMLKQFIDNKDFTFEDAAKAAAKGGLQAAALQTVMQSPLAAAERRRMQERRGDVEVFNDATRLRIVVDPAAETNPTKGQEYAIKLAGGSPRFSVDASRVNVPRVTSIFQDVAGRTGNPNLDGNLSPDFFQARLLQEGRAYDNVARLPGMRQVVEDWKRANFNSAAQYRKNAETGKPEALEAARQFRAEADSLFQQIEQAAIRASRGTRGSTLMDDLRDARTKISQLHAIQVTVNPADFKPDQVQILGQMYRDNPRYFTGDLASVARIAAAQPQVFQNVRTQGTKAISSQDLSQVPLLRYLLQTGPGQKSIGTTGLDPTFLAQFARYGTGEAVQQATQPTR